MPVDSSPILLHSRYNPEKEAVRFLDSQAVSYVPSFIVISEPGESYLAPVLRERFPQAKLVALRFTSDLYISSDSAWDFVWRPPVSGDISRYLFNLIPDEYLNVSLFLAWKPADAIWPEASLEVWSGISEMIKMQTSVMHTRSHFGRKWLSNMLKNSVWSTTVIEPVHTSKPVFLAAAGPSLENQFPLERSRFYVCAVSSAISSLKYRECVPDLCISTDGGYWAAGHFREISPAVPVAFPLEAAIPSVVLENNPLVLLNYGSEIEKKLLELIGVKPESAARNGTVSGTAALYSLSHTTAPVFAAGLDLRNSNSWNHARPHVSDIFVNIGLNRLHPLSGSLYAGNLESASLDMYASWFSSRDTAFRQRFFRLLPAGRPLSGIRDVLFSELPKCDIPGVTDTRRYQKPLPRDLRQKAVSAWLQETADVFFEFADAAETAIVPEKYAALLFGNQLYAEILQLVSYTDYINAFKKSRSLESSDEFIPAATGLCRKANEVLQKMIMAVRRYG